MVARPALEPAGSAITEPVIEPVIEPVLKLRAECVAAHELVHVQLARELVHVQLLRERQPADGPPARGPPLARTLKQRAQRNS